MTLISRSLIRKIVLLLAPIAAFFMTSPGLAQKPKDESRSVMTWEHGDDGYKRRLEIRGKAEFTDDYTDIKDVSEGGVVRIEEVRDGQSRRYEVRRDVAGQLAGAFFMNGQARQIDATARTWIAELVLNAVRQGGIDADKRVQTILRQRGVAGVFQETELINSDYARRHYYAALVKHGNLNAAAFADTLAHAAQHIKSDYDQSQFLIAVAPALEGKDSAMPVFFKAIDTIKSNYERSRVLKTLLKRSAPSKELLIQIATSTKGINSDYEKAGVLKDVAVVYLDDSALSGVFFSNCRHDQIRLRTSTGTVSVTKNEEPQRSRVDSIDRLRCGDLIRLRKSLAPPRGLPCLHRRWAVAGSVFEGGGNDQV